MRIGPHARFRCSLPRSPCPYPTLLVPTLGAGVKAIQYRRFGGPEVLELVDLPDPTPGAGQIRVAVRAAGVNPIDWKLRSGIRGGDLPQTTGRELAGAVDALGGGVSDVAVGDEVFGFAAGGGGAAELALAADYARSHRRSASPRPPASRSR
jgi:NADPH:quinone reductase-like Zn-dependent oxidoreductase